MNEHDQELLQLFSEAREEFDVDAFTGQTLERIKRQALISRWKWIALGSFVVLVEVLLLDFAATFSQTLSTTLVDLGEGRLAQLLDPLNSVAGLLAILLLAGHRYLRSLGR